MTRIPPVIRHIAIALAFVAAALWLLSGCATGGKPSNLEQSTPPLPPMPPLFEVQSSEFRVQSSATPLPPRTITIFANPSFGATGYVLFAASVPFLSSMVPHATNTAPAFTEPATEPQRFYQMKAINDHGLSDWATQ